MTDTEIKQLLEQSLEGGDILLVVPPFSSYTPALGPHILQKIAQQKGFKTEILYLDLLLAAVVGFDLSKKLGGLELFQYWTMLNERLFSRKAYGMPALGHTPELIHNEAESTQGSGEDNISFFSKEQDIDYQYFFEVEKSCFRFIEVVGEFIAELPYKILGCTINIGQTNASVALINEVKKLKPEVIGIVGGPNCKGDLAEGIASLSNQINFIFSDESEDTFSTFLDNFAHNNLPTTTTIYEGQPVADLDTIPLPDYKDYLNQFKLFLQDTDQDSPYLFYETGRGCVWGKKSKCSFCSRVFDGIPTRQKSAKKVLSDLKELKKMYPGKVIFITDDHMPLSYFDELLPTLEKEPDVPVICYYILSNVTLDQLIALKKANVTQINPGIEAFSTSLLKLIRKGTTGRNGLLLLRNARSVGLVTSWNLLWGMPKDTIKPYEDYLEVLPLIHHFQPPVTFTRVHFERFSVYYERPEDFGIKELLPYKAYKMGFPEYANIDKLAFGLMADYHSESIENPDVMAKINAEIEAWKKNFSSTILVIEKDVEGYKIHDHRKNIGRSTSFVVSEELANDIMTAKSYPQNKSHYTDWAIEQKLGVVMDGWYIPLIIAKPALLKAFENKSRGKKMNPYQKELGVLTD